MEQIKALLQQFTEFAAQPQKSIQEHKAATGKGAVGVLPYYAPEELIYASGYLPVGIWGGQKQIKKAPTYLPAFACSIMQSVMEMELEGAYDIFDAILMSVPCDTLKCLSQKWKGTAPVIVFTHPQNRKLESANQFLVEEYKIVKAKLEKILGVTISTEAIQKAIAVYNANKQATRLFLEIAAAYPQVINPIDRHAVMKARLFMDKAKHTALLQQLIAAITVLPITPWQGKRVVLTGITAEPNEFLALLQEFNIAVVADDLAQESRQVRVDTPNHRDPLYALAKAWQNFDGCSLAVNTKKPRGSMLIDMVHKYGADAVIVCMMKFCDPEEWDYPVMYREMEEAGVKSLMLEIDQQTVSFEQAKTRIQSFVEMLA
ncbi:MAG: 2-hydroxyacyl-CoA dehydratase family protein [Sporomusaceae bacterium]|nr:2-hydroxyacyl-CoA dehydratase family protein [Sporomusaceae bacterium]